MARTPIGEPIPIGDLPSLTENTRPVSPTDDNLPSVSKNTQPVAIPADNLPAPVDDLQSALPSPEASPTSGWSDLMQIGWQLAWLPAMTWSSFFQASWKAWETAQPQSPTR